MTSTRASIQARRPSACDGVVSLVVQSPHFSRTLHTTPAISTERLVRLKRRALNPPLDACSGARVMAKMVKDGDPFFKRPLVLSDNTSYATASSTFDI